VKDHQAALFILPKGLSFGNAGKNPRIAIAAFAAKSTSAWLYRHLDRLKANR